mgnify:CR=1 FL=1
MARLWSSQGSAARPPKLRHMVAPPRDIAAMHCRAMDGGDTGPKLRGALLSLGRWTLQIVNRSDTAKGFEVLPRTLSSPLAAIAGREWVMNARSLGSVAAADWQRIGKNPLRAPKPGC